MESKTNKKHVSTDDLSKAIQRRRWQIAFDKKPKRIQDIMTRLGLNPYEDNPEDRIQYRDFTVNTERK